MAEEPNQASVSATPPAMPPTNTDMSAMCTPVKTNGNTPAKANSSISTPAPINDATPVRTNGGTPAQQLSDAIAGATPGRHGEPEFKCVYPPSEKTQSLVVEHFGFLPITFIDEIINSANDTIYRATDALCKFVEKEQGSSEATSQAVTKAETLLEHAVDKNFDKFELYALRNLFNIPQGLEDYIVMPHQSQDVIASSDSPVFAEDEAALDKELDDLRRQLVVHNMLKTRLQNDIAKVERGVARLRALNEQLRITDVAQSEFKGRMPQVVAEVRAQVAEAARLVDQLMETLAAPGCLSPMDSLKEPAGRDLYIARMSDLQISSWDERKKAQLHAN
ncbi:hypothetical protein IW140_001899 [Coemansia sp. RSA 1813]|nr:hypothetical protein EV178_005067 [Coemansia sp. RSA 1646]KAJ1769918.1 hypothetical protein LPJ74_003639 [Coemansia sp. RSA 1843]KAJ2087256.1 hypothetical protein IW138_005102 [Coemansia sp. RSA 986]KAJ2212083.1 hypothetical protein EV179_004945 [Coemansia sp. RSA 487]KAJ2570945.1 hypothetical protein IW140_001899 [Coemansia sp. RSA 1813]